MTLNHGAGSYSCMVLATLTLDGGSSVSGTLAESQVDCTDDGTPIAITPKTSVIIGTLEGRTLRFTPQPPEGESHCSRLNFEGEATEDRIIGTVRTTPVFCQGTYVQLNGTWQADKVEG